MTRTAGAPIGCQRPSRFWGLGCPKIYHEAEDTLDLSPCHQGNSLCAADGKQDIGGAHEKFLPS
ncbi:hypothetical protein [Thiolapillus sp.]|uniref:hypothetical protein n=1 Tax=Thiolapillus sp. TaxID=2017437 RepID=UPI0025FDAE60|nr:hypothetical protein [Thiolapillus sp.]